MKPFTKQTTLTAALLAVLATQVTWNSGQPVMNSIDLSSRFPSGEGQAGEAGRATGAPAAARPDGDITLRAPAPGAAVAGATGAQPDKPAVAAAAPQGAAPAAAAPAPAAPAITASANPTREFGTSAQICGKEYEIKFIELKEDNQPVIRATARLNGNYVASATQPGTYASTVEASEARTKFQSFLTDAVQKKDCPQVASAPPAPSEEDKQAKDEREKKIKRGLLNCTGDEDGKALRGAEKLDCHLARLEGEEEEMEDVADSRDRRDRDRDRSRSRTGKGSASSRFASSLDYVMREASILLASKDEVDNEDGQDLKERIEDALDAARDNGVVERSLIIQAEARVSNLKKGLAVDDRAEKYEKSASQLDSLVMQLESAQMRATDPFTSNTIGMQLQQARQQREMLSNQMSSDVLYREYQTLQSRGQVGMDEYQNLTRDYTDLLNQLRGSSQQQQPGATAGTLAQGAQSAIPWRQQNTQAMSARSFGVTLPQFPGQTTQYSSGTPLLAPQVGNPRL